MLKILAFLDQLKFQSKIQYILPDDVFTNSFSIKVLFCYF